MNGIEICDAVEMDAAQACEVMERSIRELCHADHEGNPEILSRWLANERPEVFRNWIAQAGNSLRVAVEAGPSWPSAPSPMPAKSP